jgi:hypothetical protein
VLTMTIQKLNIHDSNTSETAALSISDIQVWSDAATTAMGAYTQAWEAANLPKLQAELEAFNKEHLPKL